MNYTAGEAFAIAANRWAYWREEQPPEYKIVDRLGYVEPVPRGPVGVLPDTLINAVIVFVRRFVNPDQPAAGRYVVVTSPNYPGWHHVEPV